MNVAMLSYHTCPLAILGGKDTGGMNVYVRDLTAELGRMGVHVDVFTRSQDEHVPHIVHELGFGNRVVHVPAGPEVPLPKRQLMEYVPQFVEGIERFAAGKADPLRHHPQPLLALGPGGRGPERALGRDARSSRCFTPWAR